MEKKNKRTLILSVIICLLPMVLGIAFYNRLPEQMPIMEWFIPIITVLVYIIMIEVPLGSDVYVGKSVCLILGILFTIIGNYMPKMNYETGKKLFHPTPKTEKSFRKMSRIMGYGFLGMGIILLILIIWV